MFYSINISIGGIIIKRLHPYIHNEIKAEILDRTLDESLFINRRVNSEGQLLTKYHFEFLVVDCDELDDLKLLASGVGNYNFIDYYEIPESFSGDGSTTHWNLRRPLASASYLPKITVDTVIQTVTVTEAVNPAAGNVYVNQTTGKMTFGSIPTDINDNVKVLYVPMFPVHVVSCEPERQEAGLIMYKLICEEV